jgi:hypothetical protein
MSIIFSPRNGKVALAIAVVTGGAVLAIGDPFVMVFLSPILGAALSLSLVSAMLPWLLGPARRGYLHGTGRQACWAYLGHTIRGDWDETGQPWVSLTDCHHASGLDLLDRLDRVPDADKRKNGAKGCGALGLMYEIGDGIRQDKRKAIQLYDKACDFGDSTSCEDAKKIRSGR